MTKGYGGDIADHEDWAPGDVVSGMANPFSCRPSACQGQDRAVDLPHFGISAARSRREIIDEGATCDSAVDHLMFDLSQSSRTAGRNGKLRGQSDVDHVRKVRVAPRTHGGSSP